MALASLGRVHLHLERAAVMSETGAIDQDRIHIVGRDDLLPESPSASVPARVGHRA